MRIVLDDDKYEKEKFSREKGQSMSQGGGVLF